MINGGEGGFRQGDFSPPHKKTEVGGVSALSVAATALDVFQSSFFFG